MQSQTTVGSPRTPRPIHRDHHLISALVGIIGFFAIWGLTLTTGAPRASALEHVNGFGVLLVALTPLVVLMPVYGWAGIVDAILWIGRAPKAENLAPTDEAKNVSTAGEAVTFFQLAAALAVAAGFAHSILGIVAALLQFGGSPHTLSAGIALALMNTLYGVFGAVLCLSFAAFVSRRHRCDRANPGLGRRSAGAAGLTVVAGALVTLLTMGILTLSHAPNW